MTEKTFYSDLLEAQKEIEAVDKDGKNPFFKSEYTTLNASILACKEVLNRHNIIVLQPLTSDENGVYVETTLTHVSGEKVSSRMRISPAKTSDPQAQGSAITYARRYSLKSMLCMSDADDDAEASMSRQVHTQTHNDITYATDKQIASINKSIKKGVLDKSIGQEIPNMTKQRASILIGQAIENYNNQFAEASEVDTY